MNAANINWLKTAKTSPKRISSCQNSLTQSQVKWPVAIQLLLGVTTSLIVGDECMRMPFPEPDPETDPDRHTSVPVRDEKYRTH